MQKIQVNQLNIEREEQNWKIDTTQLQDLRKVTIINNVVLVKEQIYHWNRTDWPEIDPQK